MSSRRLGKEGWFRLAIGAGALAALVGLVVSAGASSSRGAERSAEAPAYTGPPIPTPPPSPAAAAELARQGCTSCHLGDEAGAYLFASHRSFLDTPPLAGSDCARCHVNSFLAASVPHPAEWLPLGQPALARIRQFHAYVQNPVVALAVEAPSKSGATQRLARFTACGLERFLAAPMPRRAGARQGMYPLEPAHLRALLGAIGPELAPCDGKAPAPATVERGRALYGQKVCGTCHAGEGAGPRLRLGIPLLARDYVRARVRLGSGDGAPGPVWQRTWSSDSGQITAHSTVNTVVMPPHPDLTDADVDALYAYITTDRSDLPTPAPAAPRDRIQVPDQLRASLYKEVQRRVFDTTCRHCHGEDAELQKVVRGVFGGADGATGQPLALPTSRLPTPVESQALREVLAPGPGCTDSRLIARLRARTHEWSGERKAGAPRGMPMTMPPLPDEAIHLVEIWSAAGCPSDVGDLCLPCAP